MTNIFVLSGIQDNEYFGYEGQIFRDQDAECTDSWHIDCSSSCGSSTENIFSTKQAKVDWILSQLAGYTIVLSESIYSAWKVEFDLNILLGKALLYKLGIVTSKGGHCYSVSYFPITFSPKVSPCPPYGDVDGDGVIGQGDYQAILEHSVGLNPLSATQLARADVNGDGKVDITDALLIGQYMVGQRTSFPVCSGGMINILMVILVLSFVFYFFSRTK